ncbi:MAG: ABC transporter ATP-binding protein [Parvibaculaceae bacterium]|nr:ABC transporter ATP-binding protein [Parvibaculaceae bacterium]HBM87204.1 ABC transporter ATP-binding protein [Rhodobiaceae bacterium]|tara:strand:- start:2200 stop:2946 length:747 start_codon:yes stop_codon:yes gene_type:complete
MSVLLKVENATKTFGGVVANRNVSLEVNEGDIAGLIGPNGSGKTTLFNSIVGAHPIDSGSVRFEGQEISKLTVPVIARRGLVRTFQQTRIYAEMNCVENMRISAPDARDSVLSLLSGFSSQVDVRAEELLDFVGLASKRFLRAGSLSFGQQKLLEFAMALMSEPKLLLLDEPTAGVNPTLINGLIDRLVRANKELGVTLLVIEHNMRVIMNLAEHITCLAHGEVLAQGSPQEVRDNPIVVEAYLGASA